MKKNLLNIFIVISLLIYYGCDKPAATELIQDITEDPIEVEIITKNPDDPSYSNGFDTTGVVNDRTGFANIIIVNGTKITAGPVTEELSMVQAVFFDRSAPVFDPFGNLIGFNTITPGILSVNGFNARVVPFKVRFRTNDGIKDTALGLKYVLFNRPGRPGDQFQFNYNSVINFQFTPIVGPSISFNFITPPEVTAKVSVAGRIIDRNLRVVVDWDKRGHGDIVLIIGAMNNRNETFPIYKIKTRDDGRLEIPAKLLTEIPRDKFNRLTFSLVRKIEHLNRDSANDLYLLSQSIHTIITDIP